MDKFYGHTNESLWAIVEGLDISKKDRVLCINGSGDQAFALSEYVGEIIAIDKNKEQINYSKRRLEALKNINYEDFFPLLNDQNFPMIKNEKFNKMLSKKQQLRYLHEMATLKLIENSELATWAGSIKYFLGEKHPFSKIPEEINYSECKIHEIRKNLDRISFKYENIIDTLKKDNNFSRVYLSNAFLSWRFHDSQDGFLNFLNILPKNCLVYSTESGNKQEARLSQYWEIDENLSTRAKKAELSNSWSPKVYKKIA